MGCWGWFRGLNPNVRVCLCYQFLYASCEAVWLTTILPEILFQVVGQKNSVVGFVVGTRGATNVLVALTCGWIIDKYKRRDRVAWCAVLVCGCAFACTVVAALTESTGAYFGALAVWGCFVGSHRPAMDTLFADSVTSGQRSGIYSVQTSCTSSGSIFGPLVALGLFAKWGDHWRMDVMRKVLICAVSAEFCTAVLLLSRLRDSNTLGAASEAVGKAEQEPGAGTVQEEVPPPPADLGSPQGAGAAADRERRFTAGSPSEDAEGTGGKEGDALLDGRQPEPRSWSCRRVPVQALVVASDIISMLASGMTVRFFPLFFAHDYSLSPAAVQGVWAGMGFSIVLFINLAQRVSLRIGRVQTVLSAKVLGIALLVYMSQAKHGKAGSVWVIVPVYMVRSALMNCTRALNRAIVMDAVRKEKRGKWAAAESINQFGWAGSAVLGGFIADRWDYRTSFLFTAGLQVAALVPWLLLVGRVGAEQKHTAADASAVAPRAARL